jgi:hypothetical protein
MKNNYKTLIERMMNSTRELSRPTKEWLSPKIGGRGTWMKKGFQKTSRSRLYI